jgi:hypothetical protein
MKLPEKYPSTSFRADTQIFNCKHKKILTKIKKLIFYLKKDSVGGGFTVFVHKSQVTDLNLPFDQAMKSNLTAWISTKEEK